MNITSHGEPWRERETAFLIGAVVAIGDAVAHLLLVNALPAHLA